METNFFKAVLSLQVAGNWKINIAREDTDKLIVSVLFFNDTVGDDARKKVPPILLKGTAEELDNGFFETISVPLQTASGLMVDMETFMKQLEEAKKQSAMEKEKADREKKEKEAKAKKYKEAFQKAEALEKEGKYKEAWSALPKISENPDFAEAIRKKQDEYESHFAHNLFSETPTEV